MITRDELLSRKYAPVPGGYERTYRASGQNYSVRILDTGKVEVVFLDRDVSLGDGAEFWISSSTTLAKLESYCFALRGKRMFAKRERAAKELVGTRVGFWTVLEYVAAFKVRGHTRHHGLRARCRCGQERLFQRPALERAHSCGCFRRELRPGDPRAKERLEARDKIRNLRRDRTDYYLYELARKRAEVRSGAVSFALKPEDIPVPETCPVTGVPLSTSSFQKGPTSPTLLRIDPRFGWVPGNVRVVSWAAAELEAALEDRPDSFLVHVKRGRWTQELEVPTPEDILMQKEALASVGCRSVEDLWTFLIDDQSRDTSPFSSAQEALVAVTRDPDAWRHIPRAILVALRGRRLAESLGRGQAERWRLTEEGRVLGRRLIARLALRAASRCR